MAYSAASGSGGQYSGSSQFLMWERYLPHTWCSLDDSRAPPAYHVDTDKGFVYSVADEAFVCQKKNHFQVTVHVGGTAADPHYVHTAGGTLEVDHLLVKVFGVKVGQSRQPAHRPSILFHPSIHPSSLSSSILTSCIHPHYASIHTFIIISVTFIHTDTQEPFL